MSECEYNIGERGPDVWTYQPCRKPATRVWDERRHTVSYYCNEHLEGLKRFHLIETEEVMVIREGMK